MTNQLPRTARRAAARAARVQILVTADEHSFIDLQLLAATLPMCATGRVFVEVPDASFITDLAMPPRMTVTFFDRSARNAPAGELAATAAKAWADEMLCDADEANRAYLLNGASAGVLQRHLTVGLCIGSDRVFVAG